MEETRNSVHPDGEGRQGKQLRERRERRKYVLRMRAESAFFEDLPGQAEVIDHGVEEERRGQCNRERKQPASGRNQHG